MDSAGTTGVRGALRWLLRAPASGQTYRSGIFLLLGGVVALPYGLLAAGFWSLLDDRLQDGPVVLVLLALTLVIAAAPALLAGVRSMEISAVREILSGELPEPGPVTELDAGTRLRAAAWYGLHLLSGGLTAAVLFIGVPTAVIFVLNQFGAADLTNPAQLEFLSDLDGWVLALLGLVLAWLIIEGIAVAGAALRALAPVLLGPSASARIAELELRSRRLAERNRLARELHDSIGHALTITTVQAAAAAEVGDRDPEFVAQALRAIDAAGRQAMADLDHVLGVLREGDRPDTTGTRGESPPAADQPSATGAPHRQPTRGLADLPQLIAETTGAGVRIEAMLAEDLVAVPNAVSREGYRIVQESLTNVLRHAGPVPVELRVRYEAENLIIVVRNPLGAEPDSNGYREPERDRPGRGIVGMTERVDLLGGRLTAGPVEDQWVVRAAIPVPAVSRS